MYTETTQGQHVWREHARVLWFISSHSASVNRAPIISKLCFICSILKHNPKNLTQLGRGGTLSLKANRRRGKESPSFTASLQGSRSPTAAGSVAHQVPSVSSCNFRLTSMTLPPRAIWFSTTLLPLKPFVSGSHLSQRQPEEILLKTTLHDNKWHQIFWVGSPFSLDLSLLSKKRISLNLKIN